MRCIHIYIFFRMSECERGLAGPTAGSWSLRASPAGSPSPRPPFPSPLPDARESRRRTDRNTNHVAFTSFHFSLLFFLYVCDSELRSSCLKNVFDNLIHWTFSCEVTYGPIHGCSVIGIGLINRRCVYSLRPQDIARSRCRLAFVRALRGARPSSLRGFSWSQNNP